jgi:hypothetical protein
LQGASATERLLTAVNGKPVKAFIVWEPVLPTDWAPPSTETMGRISDQRVTQFWDKGRLISKSMGEHDRSSVVWDQIEVFDAGTVWTDRPPDPLFSGGPVVRAAPRANSAVKQALEKLQAKSSPAIGRVEAQRVISPSARLLRKP